MRLILVRHGEPDYAKDCLTPTGWKQARAAAERLRREGITEICSSSMGRALETAAPTAEMLGLPIRKLDFMREISWGGEGIPDEGHPWTLAARMIAEENFDFQTRDWRDHPFFRDNLATAYYDRVSAQFDALMREWGYTHEGRRFLCGEDTRKNVALFFHGGSGGCVLSSLLGLPFPYVLAVMPYDFTAVIILNFPDSPGEYVFPRLELFNDIGHLHAGPSDPRIQQTVDSAVP